jgi:hypothetical protein
MLAEKEVAENLKQGDPVVSVAQQDSSAISKIKNFFGFNWRKPNQQDENDSDEFEQEIEQECPSKIMNKGENKQFKTNPTHTKYQSVVTL